MPRVIYILTVKFFFVALLGGTQTCFAKANQQIPESTAKLINRNSPYEQQLEQLNGIADSLFPVSPDVALALAQEALKLAQKEGVEKDLEAQAFKMATFYSNLSQHGKALDYLRISLDYSKQQGNSIYQATILRRIGSAYYYIGYYDKSLEAFMEALEISNSLSDDDGAAAAYNNMGLIYQVRSQYDLAMDSYLKAEDLFKQLNDEPNRSLALLNIGNIYYFKGDLDEALSYYTRSVEISKPINKIDNVALAYQNMALVHELKGNLTTSLTYSVESLELYRESNNEYGIASLSNNIGNYYMEQADYALAEKYFKEAVATSEKIGSLSLKQISYLSLSYYFEQQQKYDSALIYFRKSVECKDSISNRESDQKIAELQTQFEMRKKDEENSRLRKQSWSLSIIGTIITLLLLTLYQTKMRANRKLRAYNEQVQQQNKELEVANSAKNRFFSIVAHDLKNPLASFMGYLDVLRQSVVELPRKDLEQELGHLYIMANGMSDLLENLLKWARNQTGAIEFVPEYIDINSLIADNIRLLEPSAQLKLIRIEKQTDCELLALADKNMISTVVRNLISNALKFTLQGGLVKVGGQVEQGAICVWVEDNGVGISEEDKAKLFKLDAKIQSSGTANEPGSGLGLVLCRDFIIKHNGTITFDSTKGEGSRFEFRIPSINQ